jgi:hypothetical protein
MNIAQQLTEALEVLDAATRNARVAKRELSGAHDDLEQARHGLFTLETTVRHRQAESEFAESELALARARVKVYQALLLSEVQP